MNPNKNEAEINLTSNTSSNQNILPRSSVLYSRFQSSTDLPFVVRALIRSKLVKNEKQAQIVLLFLVFALILTAAVFFYTTFRQPEITI